ncbi:MAG: hypothetical protein LPK00_03930 [Bacillaceae bacterium]|nr:hypothetical protein [Bacillaceae bacterium]
MVVTQLDLKEFKNLKKKQLIQNNILFLFLFILIKYFSQNGNITFLMGVFCVLLWIIVVILLYTLVTGRPIGTKTSKLVQVFDRKRMGEKRWKKLRITEVIIISVLNVIVTILLFPIDFNTGMLDFPISALPFIGAWLGYNIGEIYRMNKL